MSRSRSLLPPLKRDWKPGTTQVGLFIRDTRGTVIEFVSGDNGTNDTDTAAAYALLKRLSR